MKILHVIPGDTFTEGMTYKDNFLASLNKKDGHEVMILSSCRTWTKTKVIYTDPEDRIMVDGVRLKKIKYKKIVNYKISEKLRILEDTYKIVEEFNPDVIRVLNPHNLTIPIIVKYKKKNPKIKLYIDSHQEYFNSAIGFVSYWIFHKMIINTMINKNIEYIDKVFYVQEGTKKFLKEMYNIKEKKMEHFPMGGIVFDKETKEEIEIKIKRKLGIKEGDIVFIHSGKMFPSKKTVDILEAFKSNNDSRFRLLLIGSIPTEMNNLLVPLIESDDRIDFLGWMDGNDLMEHLIIGDVYLQPGSASATVIQALCCGNALVISGDIIGYDMLMEDTGWYASNKRELVKVFEEIIEKPEILNKLKNNAINLAEEKFNYVKLARKLTE